MLWTEIERKKKKEKEEAIPTNYRRQQLAS